MVFALILLLLGLLSIERQKHRQAATTAPRVEPASLPAKLLAAGKLSKRRKLRAFQQLLRSAWLRRPLKSGHRYPS